MDNKKIKVINNFRDFWKAISDKAEDIHVKGKLVYTIKHIQKVDLYFWYNVVAVSVVQLILYFGVLGYSSGWGDFFYPYELLILGLAISHGLFKSFIVDELNNNYEVVDEFTERETFPVTKEPYITFTRKKISGKAKTFLRTIMKTFESPAPFSESHPNTKDKTLKRNPARKKQDHLKGNQNLQKNTIDLI